MRTPDLNPKLLTPTRGAVLLAAVAGYVDTLGFVALFGLFTAHVTGNFVLIGAELVHPQHGVLLKLLVFPAFIAAVALARVIVLACGDRGYPPLPALLWLEAAFLLGFLVAGWRASPIESADSGGAMVAGLLGAFAMGIQNGVGRLVLARLTPTTIMTGNVTQLVIDVVDHALGRASPETRQRLPRLGWPVLAFGLGAACGAAAWQPFGFPALAPAVAVVIVLAWQAGAVDPQPA